MFLDCHYLFIYFEENKDPVQNQQKESTAEQFQNIH